MSHKVALITGAGSGIGKACAVALGKSGFAVVLVGRRAVRLAEVECEILAAGGTALSAPSDVSDEDAVHRCFDLAQKTFGRLDVLFNNAGVNIGAKPIDEMSLEEWRGVIDINLTGAFLCAREAFRIMRHQEPMGGRIINNGSLSAYVPRIYSAPYTASKHAITGLTRSLSLDGRAFDIACSQIDIGNAQSEMTQSAGQGLRQANGERRPEPVMDVRHVADAVAYIASLPLDANVQFMTVMATQMPYIGRG